ncbi:AHH domain-containing protein [Austwickia sp. TVS 96-490-7B]|uniref:AHH domain-containing protein n=1 Tax=Austwickia sp. TVS 96-490-7B TaxID=2830843 RepID=UPI001C566EFB|nr:AHH domain-containing protein [Austwickia sp. TVS 96-490-7B]
MASAANHDIAEAMSAGKRAPSSPLPSMPSPKNAAAPVSCAGGNGLTPDNWGIIAEVAALAWPDADIDKLRAAADAWDQAARTVDDVGHGVQDALAKMDGLVTGEMGAVEGKFAALAEHVDLVGKQCRDLRDACRGYADEMQKVHDEVIEALVEMAASIGVTIVVGVALSVVTAGASAAASGLISAAEAGVFATRISVILLKVAAIAARISSTVTKVIEVVGATGRAGALTVRMVRFSGKLVTFAAADSVVNVGVDAVMHGGRPVDVAGDVRDGVLYAPFGPLGEKIGRMAAPAIKKASRWVADDMRTALARVGSIEIPRLPEPPAVLAGVGGALPSSMASKPLTVGEVVASWGVMFKTRPVKVGNKALYRDQHGMINTNKIGKAVTINERRLGRAMEAEGRKKEYGYTAHHILPGGYDRPVLNAVKEKFAQWGFDFDDPANGAWLPNRNAPKDSVGVSHVTIHTLDYLDWVARELVSARNLEEGKFLLRKIGSLLESGSTPWIE